MLWLYCCVDICVWTDWDLVFWQSSDVTVYKLKDEIEDAASRLMFLLDYAIFPCKDILWFEFMKMQEIFQ